MTTENPPPIEDQVERRSISELPPVQQDHETPKKKWLKPDAEKTSEAPDQEPEAKEEVKKGSVADYFRIFTYAKTFDWILLAICFTASIGAGAAMPLMFVVFGRLVNNITGYATPDSGTDSSTFTQNVNSNSLYMIYLFIGKFVLSYISMYTVRITGLRISASLRLAYLDALFKQPLSYVDTISIGKISHRITTSANTIQLGISQQLALLLQALAFLIGFYVVAFIFNAILTLVASAIIPVMLFFFLIPIPIMIQNLKKVESAKEAATALTHEVFASIRIVAAFSAEGRLSRRYESLNQKIKTLDNKNAPLIGVLMAPLMTAMFMTCALTFWFGIKQFQRGHIDNVGTIAIVYIAVAMATMYMGRVYAPIIAMSNAATSASEMFATLDAYIPDVSGLKSPDASAEEDIAFEDVVFAYPGRADVPVLQKVNATFETGKTTAIVGPSGSGKSTILGLLQRWYDIDNGTASGPGDHSLSPLSEQEKLESDGGKMITGGSIRVGPHNLRELDAYWWRQQIGFVQQEPFLFNDTIYKNVAYGLYGTEHWDKSEEKKRELVKEACREAFADKFIMTFPQGYDTLVGENGLKISGGQRQRIAIARSIIKKPKILILDEATSALDVNSERIVQRTLDHVARGRTTIVIAHRLSTIKRADKIIVMRKGIVIEQGSHAELLNDEDGFYKNLVNAQTILLGDDGRDPNGQEEMDFEALLNAASNQRDETADATEEAQTDSKAPPKKGKYLRSFSTLVRERVPKYWHLYIGTFGAALTAGSMYPLLAWMFAQLINVFTLTGAALSDRGNFWSLMFFVLGLASLITYCALGYFAALVAIAVVADYRQEYFECILRKPIPFYDAEGASPGTLTSQVSNDTTKLQQMMGAEMALASISVFNIIGSTIISLIFSWKLGLIGLFVLMPVITLAGFFRIRLEIRFEQMTAEVFADSSQFATEAVGAYRTVTSLNLEPLIIGRYTILLDEHARMAIKKALAWTVVFAFSDSIEILCTAFLFWYGGRLLASGEIGVVGFFVLYMALIQSTQAAGMFFSYSPNIAEAGAAANRILSYREPGGQDGHSSPTINGRSGAMSLEFSDVTFTYESRKEPVLSKLSLKVEPGQFAALVGPSGCGKSTVVSLIERFYNIGSGSIICDGTDITSVSVYQHRSNISLVSQEPTLYEGTIRENIILSVEESEATDESIHAACTEAQIHEFISSLPDGYNTALGPKGISLSGGQKQRIALARALLRHPRLLLLDEATSSLDSTSEKQVQEAIERTAGKGGVTILAVAHRLATVQNADVIFVMGKDGGLVERGSHSELIQQKGVYYQMCQSQALDR